MKEFAMGLLKIIVWPLGLFLAIGIILYVVLYYGKMGQFQPFEMATVTALLGGFALAGGFSSKARLDNLAFSLRRIGAIYIIATIAFFLFGLYLPLTEKTLPEELINISVPAAVFGVYAGAILSAIATCWFVLVIPRIFKGN